VSGSFQIHDIGSREIVFKSQLTAEEVTDLMGERGRVFIFSGLDWTVDTDAEMGEAAIRFRPGNGMATIDSLENAKPLYVHKG